MIGSPASIRHTESLATPWYALPLPLSTQPISCRRDIVSPSPCRIESAAMTGKRRGLATISEKSRGAWEHGNIFFSRFLKFPDFQSISFFEKLREFAISKAPHLWFFRENQRFPDAEPRMFANANHANQEFAELRLHPDDFFCYLLIFVGPPSATGWHCTLVPNDYRPRT